MGRKGKYAPVHEERALSASCIELVNDALDVDVWAVVLRE